MSHNGREGNAQGGWKSASADAAVQALFLSFVRGLRPGA